jgi:hypothetical protein
MAGHRFTGLDIVAVEYLRVGRRLVGHHRDGRQPGVDGRLEQRALATLRLGHDQPIDAMALDPLEGAARIVAAQHFETRQHQAGVPSRQFLLDPRE